MSSRKIWEMVVAAVILSLEDYDPNLKGHNNDEAANLESDDPRAKGTRWKNRARVARFALAARVHWNNDLKRWRRKWRRTLMREGFFLAAHEAIARLRLNERKRTRTSLANGDVIVDQSNEKITKKKKKKTQKSSLKRNSVTRHLEDDEVSEARRRRETQRKEINRMKNRPRQCYCGCLPARARDVEPGLRKK
jgi:hypothetical protein